jgi:hypothetical protein
VVDGEPASGERRAVSSPIFDFEIEREFGLSHADFFRVFPRIEPGWQRLLPLLVETPRDDGRVLQIELSDQHERKLASLRVPYIEITFRFAGWSENQRIEFFEKFDRAFQKGGG